MDFLISVLILAGLLIFCIIYGFSIFIPLITGLICFTASVYIRKFKATAILKMVIKGIKKSRGVIEIFLLIGLITALWRACGTIPFLVYYGTKIIIPQYFVLFCFLLCCAVSATIGTSLGTVGTIGVVLMVLAKAGNINPNIIAGAILSGAYFGDRCAPTSSSANLVAAITNTELYTNVKNMFKTSFPAFILTCIIYLLISRQYPLAHLHNTFLTEIENHFNISLTVTIPVLIIIVMTVLKFKVKLSMLFSIIASIILILIEQKMPLKEIINTMFAGYKPHWEGQFASIIAGGGVQSMLKVSLIILIASAYAGIFEETNMLAGTQELIEKLSNKINLFPAMIVTSLITGALACNQSFAAILNEQLLGKIYKKNRKSSERLALDIENTIIVMAALIPWNIAAAAPIVMLDVDKSCILFAFYLFLIPLTNLLFKIKIYEGVDNDNEEPVPDS